MTTCDILLWAVAAVGLFGVLTTITLFIVIVWVSRANRDIVKATRSGKL